MYYLSHLKKINKKDKRVKKHSCSKILLKIKHTFFALRNTLHDYCRESSLHGFKYVGDPKLPIAERLFWWAVLLFLFYISYVFTLELLFDAILNPIEMSLNPISTPIWDIPFPAILICSPYPVRKSVFNLKDSFINNTNTKHMYYSKIICSTKEEFGEKIYNQVVDEDFFSFLNQAAIPCEDLLVKCKWDKKNIDCCEIFKPIITLAGQCYIFNMLPGEILYRDYKPPMGLKDILDERTQFWQISNGYPNVNLQDRRNVYPYWATKVGDTNGLVVDLKDNKDDWQSECSGRVGGHGLKIFSPFQSPNSIVGVEIANNMNTQIQLSPFSITANTAVRRVPLSIRGCVFEDEIKLKYFKMYTHTNCLLDCYISNMIRHCSCIPFYFQSILGNLDLVYCTDAKLVCVVDVVEQMNQVKVSSADLESCICINLCTTLSFDYQTIVQPIVSYQNKSLENMDDNHTNDIARLSVYFTDQEFTGISRRVSTSLNGLLADCGGLLGLLLGFSLMTVIELIYFATFRPIIRAVAYYYNSLK